MNIFFLFVLFSTFVATASANCNPTKQPNNGQCKEYGGQCSKAADIFLNQIGVVSKAPQNVLSYGRFCGAATKCPALNNDKGNVQDVEACDVNFLDDACKVHDECLDNAGNDPGSDGDIDPSESCPCNADLLGKLLFAASTAGVAPTDKLCDEDFYDKGVITVEVAPSVNVEVPYSAFLSGFDGLGESPEAILLAAPFCALFISADADGNPGECYDGFPQFANVCDPLIGALSAL